MFRTVKSIRSNFRYIFVPLFTLVALLGNAQNTDLDKQLGNEGALQVEQQIGIYDHDLATAYIQEIGARLMAQLKAPLFEYKFLLVDMPEPNAFALPGGHVYISRGLICLANNEAQIATVMGHEIVHSEQRHSVQQMQKSILPTLLQLPGAIVGTVVSEDLGRIINAPIASTSQVFLSKYSRSHETEADKYGVMIAGKAGYDPAQLGIILTNLSKEVELLTGQQEKFSYFASHPFTPSRVKNIDKLISKGNYTLKPDLVQDRETFLQKFDGMYYSQNPANGVFVDNNFMHPVLDLFVQFPDGWEHTNTPTYCGAVDTNQKGMVYLGLASENVDPEVLGEKMAEKIRAEHKTEPERAEKISKNGLDAYILSLTDTTGAEPAGIHMLWFRLNGITYEMAGVAFDSEFSKLKETALSIRTLTEEEKNGIRVKVLRIVKAQEGESIESLSQRTNNGWNIDMTCLMNGISPEKTFSEGEPVKILQIENYRK